MQILLSFVIFFVGLGVLLKGADWLTTYSAKIAKAIGVSEMIIGLTLVAFGTSLPELAVSSFASIMNVGSIAIGNVVGSNIANIGLVIGISALLAPLAIKRDSIKQGYIMLGISFLGAFLILNGVGRIEGAILFTCVLAYVYYLSKKKRVKTEVGARGNLLKNIMICVVGIMGVVIGAKLLVDSAINIAHWFSVPEVIIGLTLVAVGTSLPELVVSAVAAVKGFKEIAIGNIIGSNIFNIACVLGVASMIRPIPVGVGLTTTTLPLMLIMAILLVLFMKTNLKISRMKGAFLLVLYVLFIILQFL